MNDHDIDEMFTPTVYCPLCGWESYNARCPLHGVHLVYGQVIGHKRGDAWTCYLCGRRVAELVPHVVDTHEVHPTHWVESGDFVVYAGPGEPYKEVER